MNILFTALAVTAGFILGVRLGLVLGRNNERKRHAAQASSAAKKKPA